MEDVERPLAGADLNLEGLGALDVGHCDRAATFRLCPQKPHVNAVRAPTGELSQCGDMRRVHFVLPERLD
jgi:hypothetical protein